MSNVQAVIVSCTLRMSFSPMVPSSFVMPRTVLARCSVMILAPAWYRSSVVTSSPVTALKNLASRSRSPR